MLILFYLLFIIIIFFIMLIYLLYKIYKKDNKKDNFCKIKKDCGKGYGCENSECKKLKVNFNDKIDIKIY